MIGRRALPPTASGGFTLIEIMILMAVLSIVLTVSSFSVNFVSSRYTPQQEQEMVKGMLAWARVQAFSIGGCSTVDVASATLTVNVFRTCGPPLANLKETQSISLSQVRLTAFTTGNPLVFYSTGGTKLANPARMEVDVVTGDTYSLVVYPLIGTIRKE